MPDIETIRTWEGRTVVDRDGGRIGTIDAIYLDDRTGQPEWALVNTGLFGTKSSFVPLTQATQTGDEVRVPYDKQLVKDAPRSTLTGTCRRARSGSCGATTAWTTTAPPGGPRPAETRWGGTPRDRRPTRP
jgi:sporulation protein YlmC with PRC-barrel domain